MMRPCLRWRMCGATAWQHKNEPVRLTAMTRSHSCKVISSNGFCSMLEEMAALLTKTSTRPNRSTDRWTMSRALAGSETSALTTSPAPPRSWTSWATRRAVPSWMSATTTRAPSCTNLSAYARPRPCPAPVMTATLSLSLMTTPPQPSRSGRWHARRWLGCLQVWCGSSVRRRPALPLVPRPDGTSPGPPYPHGRVGDGGVARLRGRM
jgi:hypothetical protein